MTEFWAAIAGAIVGGAISLFTTAFLGWLADLRLRKSRVISLQFRLTECLTDLQQINRHLVSSLSISGDIAPKDQFCHRVLELRGGSVTPIPINASELSIFSKKRHDKLVQDISELIRARNISIAAMSEYNELKHTIDEKMASLGRFEKSGDQNRLIAEFAVANEPILMGKIYKANDFIDHLYDMTSEVLEEKKSIVDDLNVAVRDYFPPWIKLTRLEFLEERVSKARSSSEFRLSPK